MPRSLLGAAPARITSKGQRGIVAVARQWLQWASDDVLALSRALGRNGAGRASPRRQTPYPVTEVRSNPFP